MDYVECYHAKGVRDDAIEVCCSLFGLFEQDVENLLEVGYEGLFEYLGRFSIHLDVLLLLLQFHVVVGLRQFIDEDHHVLVLPNLLHHELADFIICDFDGVHLGVLGQSLEQVPLKF